MKGYKRLAFVATAFVIGGLLLLSLAGAALADGPWGRGGSNGAMQGSMMGETYGPNPQPGEASPGPREMRYESGSEQPAGVWGYMQNAWGTMMRGWYGMMGGFMGGWSNMMGSGWYGGSMMGNWGWLNGGTPISAAEVEQVARDYVASYGNSDLEVAEIMEFDNHFYVQAREQSTGRYAFEFLVDRYSGTAHPEPGPNMMWNTRYGHMGGSVWGGMMGSGWNTGTGAMNITPEQAVQIAQDYLDNYRPGLKAADEADAFYGYYTIHILQDGEVVGMLSVNGYSGSVWPHTWHGTFLGMVGGDEH